MFTDRRRAFTLLELLVALALLGIAGTSLVSAVAQTRATMHAVHEAELRTRRATVVLAGLAREPRASLAQKTGRRHVRGHEVRISRIARDLFTIAVVDTATRTVLLETTVYRPEDRVGAR